MPKVAGTKLSLPVRGTGTGFYFEPCCWCCRLKGDLKVALRRVIQRYELPVIITANQNIILTEIEPSWKSDILNTLHGAGVRCDAT